ncbi:MAG: phage/plasmid primase, P4 family [Hydrogenophaga sp.]|nr:phage/plasmid primase, P4 family [Hydrogenophaga sp.]
MTDYFKTAGAQLLANGYLIVPIRPGEKAPALGAWQRARMTTADLFDFPGHGVGILCGQGAAPVVGVDIDVSHPVIGPAIIDWCRKHLGWAPERIGAAPRTLLTYRAAEAGWAKGNSVTFFDPADPVKPNGKRNEQRIEILGLGQQFVAYHVHPDTGRPYEWVDLFGGLEYVDAGSLPVVTDAQVEALMAEFARLVRDTQGIDVVNNNTSMSLVPASEDDALLHLSLKVGVDIERAREMLGWLANDRGQDYDTWLAVGMALHHEYDGSDAALALWQEWGSTSDKYEPGEDARKWRSFGRGSRQTSLRWLIKICNQAKAEREALRRRETMDTIRARIRDASDQYDLTETVARDIRAVLPEAPAARAEVFGLFQQKFKDITSTNLPVADVRRMLVDHSRQHASRQKRPLTEFGNAERMIDKYGQGMRFVPETGTWYLWTGVHWRQAADITIEHLAKETVKALSAEVEQHGDEAAEFFAFCSISQQAKMVRNMVQLAASDPRIMLPADELDKHPHLLGVKNGIVDLSTGALLPADPLAYITRTCACEYHAEARAPLFERSVREAFFDDDEIVEYLYRCLGYTLQGQPREDIMFMPVGVGSNGKSTVFGAVRNTLGGYSRSAEASSFISDSKAGGNAGGAREDLVRLRGARFVYVNEPDEGGELREGAVKSMTGGDAVTARGLYAKASVEITPTWVVWMPTNHKPIIKGSDNGIWRRMGLLPFERNFDTDTEIVKDGNRRENVMRESEGILALMVRWGLVYRKTGLNPPAKIKNARDSYRNQMDLLSEWLDECCDTGPGLTEQSSALWQSWEQFAKNRGLLGYIKTSVSLGRRLDQRFPAERGNGGLRMRKNIRLKTVFQPVDGAGGAGQGLF